MIFLKKEREWVYPATHIWQYLLLNSIRWIFYFAILVSHHTDLETEFMRGKYFNLINNGSDFYACSTCEAPSPPQAVIEGLPTPGVGFWKIQNSTVHKEKQEHSVATLCCERSFKHIISTTRIPN